nr:MAG TPA: hypothetical protein [Caudoviricetes sp.]
MVLAPRVCDIHRHGRLGRIAGPLGTGRRCPSGVRRRRTGGILGSLARFRDPSIISGVIPFVVAFVAPVFIPFGSSVFHL